VIDERELREAQVYAADKHPHTAQQPGELKLAADTNKGKMK